MLLVALETRVVLAHGREEVGGWNGLSAAIAGARLSLDEVVIARRHIAEQIVELLDDIVSPLRVRILASLMLLAVAVDISVATLVLVMLMVVATIGTESQVCHKMVKVVQKAGSESQSVENRVEEAGIAQIAEGGNGGLATASRRGRLRATVR